MLLKNAASILSKIVYTLRTGRLNIIKSTSDKSCFKGANKGFFFYFVEEKYLILELYSGESVR